MDLELARISRWIKFVDRHEINIKHRADNVERLEDTMPESLPSISIVTTLMRTRDRGYETLKSWRDLQTYPRELIQFVLIQDVNVAQVDPRISSLLQPGDVLLPGRSHDEMEQYAVAADRATGKWLLFTEAHCIAAPDCLARLVEEAFKNELDGVCVRTLPTRETARVARFEARIYLEDMARWELDGDWRKFTKRGFLVRADAFRSAGGLEFEYSFYAELLFAARLNSAGFRVGCANDAQIEHYNDHRLFDLLEYVKDYHMGESRFHQRNPDYQFPPNRHPIFVGHFRAFKESILEASHGRTGWMVFKAYYHCLGQKKVRRLIFTALRAASATLIGERSRLTWSAHWLRLRYLWHLSVYYFPGLPDDAKYEAFTAVWQLLGVRTRLDYTRRHPAGWKKRHPLPWAELLGVDRTDDNHSLGFYSVEEYQGRLFRWASPIASLWVILPPGIWRLRLDVGRIIEARTIHVTLYRDGEQLGANCVGEEAGYLEFDVRIPQGNQADGHVLTFVSEGLEAASATELRTLAWPLFAIHFERDEEASVATQRSPLALEKT